MSRKIIKLVALTGAPLCALQATPGLAQGGGEGSRLEEIIVTARRVEERLQDVPISITVFNQEQLNNRNVASSVDLAKFTPSLSVNSRFGPEKSSFILRGFSADNLTAPTVAVYLAEVVAPRIQSNTPSGNGAGVGPMFDLQNVQVLKGPQGTLFGRNTTGGAVLFVPQKPTNEFGGYVEGMAGNHDALRLQGVLNLPMNDMFRARLGVDRYKREGYLNNRHDLGGVGPDDFNDINYTAVRASLVADLTENLENYTLFSWVDTDTNGTMGRLAFCNPALPSPLPPLRAADCAQVAAFEAAGAGYYDVANSIPEPFNKQRTWQLINTTTWKATDTLTIKNIASYSETKERYALNINGDAHDIPNVQTFPGFTDPQGHQRTYTEELQFQGRTSDDRFTWQAGGYLEISDPIGDQEQIALSSGRCSDLYALQCTLLPGVGSMAVSRNTYEFRDYALFAQGTYKLTDQWSLTAGLRYTWDREYSHSHNYIIRPLPANNGVLTGPDSATFTCTPPAMGSGTFEQIQDMCDLEYSVKSRKPTWLIGLDYKPNDDLLLYAKYARGYRAGGINPQVNGPEDAVTWRPEKIDDYEAGMKASFHGTVSGNFNINFFYNDFRDQQASIFVPACTPAAQGPDVCTSPVTTGIQFIANAGESEIKGVEVDSMLQLFDDFRFDLSYAYLDAKLKKLSPPPNCSNASYVCSQARGQPLGRLTFAPKNRVTATATYRLPLNPSFGELSLSATFTHTDKQRYSYTAQAAYEAGLIPFDSSELPETDIWDLNLNWKDIGGKGIDVGLFVTNLTKEKYWVGSAGIITTAGADAIFPGEPRMYGARVKYNFGGK